MSFQIDLIKHTYEQLSGLYKNPTRAESASIDGVAAPNVNDELMKRYKSLRQLFIDQPKNVWTAERALYYKVLALLCEVEDYFGLVTSLRNTVVELCTTPRHISIAGPAETTGILIEQFAQTEADGAATIDPQNFIDPDARSEIKAKIRCCVAAIESRRREAELEDLVHELDILERFIKKNLHLRPKYPAWTTLAFVLSAQARLARQAENYERSRRKLRDEVHCLDQRGAEIINLLFDAEKTNHLSEQQIQALKDDLVFIRRKQTLSTFFNVGLATFQRGFLKTANQACQSARLQFRLHGLFFQEVFNDLIILSIKRARTSRGEIGKFRELKDDLENNLIPRLNPATGIWNPKLYLYSLRELAVLQYYCSDETQDMLATLDRMDDHMEEHGPFSDPWRSRVSNQRARALWRDWVQRQDGSTPEAALNEAQKAFSFACGLNELIPEYEDATALCKAIGRSRKTSLIDTIESLVTYGSIQASAKQFAEAIKSATAVIQLSRDYNPRLCAMGYLVRAEAFAESEQLIEAQRDVEQACMYEAKVDHRYVADRRNAVVKAIERRLPQPSLFLGDMGKTDFNLKGTNRLLGWFIATKTDIRNKSEVIEKLGVSKERIANYLRYLKKNKSDPYYYLLGMLSKRDEESTDEDG
jgi:hypothetical protein